MSDLERYSRQTRFLPIGDAGQRRLLESKVAIIGLGALGTVSADLLARAGVGHLRLVDRDFVELSNLQRQSLFTESDVQKNLPKAIAARQRLLEANSSIDIEAIVEDVNPHTVEELISGMDLVLDALDNFESRFVLNDACTKLSIPWIYAAAVGSYGLVMPILPGTTPCLRCLVGTLPAPGTSPTCESAGVVAPITHTIASIQSAEALKYLTANLPPESIRLTSYDVWSGHFHQVRLGEDARKQCPLCAEGRMEYLEGMPLRTITLCGRNAVQLIPSAKADMDFPALSNALSAFGSVQFNDFLLKCASPPYELTLFRDGRAIIKGTEDAAAARSLYSKMVGS